MGYKNVYDSHPLRAVFETCETPTHCLAVRYRVWLHSWQGHARLTESGTPDKTRMMDVLCPTNWSRGYANMWILHYLDGIDKLGYPPEGRVRWRHLTYDSDTWYSSAESVPVIDLREIYRQWKENQ